MSERFGYAIDKRYLPLLLPFGLRGSKERRHAHGRRLPPGDLRLHQDQDAAGERHRGAHHPELPLVDSIRCSRIHGRRRPELRDEPQRGGMHPLRGEGAITAAPQWPLGAHRDRGRSRRADQRVGGRARRNIWCLLSLSRPATWILTTTSAACSCSESARGRGCGQPGRRRDRGQPNPVAAPGRPAATGEFATKGLVIWSADGSALSPVNTRSYRVRARAFQSVAGSISHKPAAPGTDPVTVPLLGLLGEAGSSPPCTRSGCGTARLSGTPNSSSARSWAMSCGTSRPSPTGSAWTWKTSQSPASSRPPTGGNPPQARCSCSTTPTPPASSSPGAPSSPSPRRQGRRPHRHRHALRRAAYRRPPHRRLPHRR